MQSDDIIKQLRELLSERPGIAAAYLMGSVAADRMRADSDIDIALLPDAGVSFPLQDRLALAAALESHLGRTVDIGVISSANLVYASEAILRGKRIVVRDKDYTDTTETRLLGVYLQFKEDRREVEEAYRAA